MKRVYQSVILARQLKGNYSMLAPSSLPAAVQLDGEKGKKKKSLETLMKVTVQGQGPTKRLRFNHKTIEHLPPPPHLTPPSTELPYDNSG